MVLAYPSGFTLFDQNEVREVMNEWDIVPTSDLDHIFNLKAILSQKSLSSGDVFCQGEPVGARIRL